MLFGFFKNSNYLLNAVKNDVELLKRRVESLELLFKKIEEKQREVSRKIKTPRI
jgi:hypothetical protein